MKAALWRVLVAGLLTGLAATGPIPAQAKATDFGAWAPAPDLLEGHVAHTATPLDDGRVLIAGGADVRGVATAGSEIFDAKANRWIRAASMRSARAAHTATRLSDGSVLVTGGRTGLSIFPVEILMTAEIYHPLTNSWTVAAPMHVPRSSHSATRLQDGRVLVVGGTTLASGSPLPAAQLEQAEVYDPKRDSWSLAGTGLPPLSGQAATLMPGGGVLVTGGFTDMGFATVSAEIFDPATNLWKPTTWPMARARYGHSAPLLPDGKVLLAGGYSTRTEISGAGIYPNPELLTASEMFDLRGNTWMGVGYSAIPRFEHSATLLRNGTVLVVGSAYASNADSQIFDPKNTEQWASTGLIMDRYLHTATMLADDRVLVAGGFGVGSPATAWIFSPMPGMSGPSGYPSVLLALAAGVLLALLMVIGVGVNSGRLARRRPGTVREDDSKWIDS